MLVKGLSFFISPFTAPSYNLPVFLFGVYAQDSEANQSLRLVCLSIFGKHDNVADVLEQFTGLLGFSALFDVVFMVRHEMHWFVKIILLIILVLKVWLIIGPRLCVA